MNQKEKQKLAQTPPAWMYPFDLGDGIETPLLHEELRSVHRSREEMIVPIIERFFPRGLAGKKAIDFACNEGFFSHLLYQRGAEVLGYDIRELNIERARIVRDLYGFDSGRLRFEVADVLALDEPADSCDVALFLGILYHLENPMGALRILHRVTKTVAIIETQLTKQRAPVVSGWGRVGSALQLPASLALFLEPDQETNNLSSFQALSFIPNDEAVRLMLTTAGFAEVSRVEPRSSHDRQYLDGDRAVYFALKRPAVKER